MRQAFHDELQSVLTDLSGIASKVQIALGRATDALLSGNIEVAESVISSDAEIDRAAEGVEEKCFELLSLQAPVAGDLRVVVAAIRMVGELERMGDLSVHVAKIARLRVPEVAVPEVAVPTIERMAAVAREMVGKVAQVIAEQDVDAARTLARDDDEMDSLRRDTFRELLGNDWEHGVEAAVDLALLGRYYERISDHAVSAANRVVFVVTGETITDS